MSRIEEKLRKTLDCYQMTEGCSRIVVGFSGGADSITLLHYLHTNFDGVVEAAHVNHQLRGEESQRDEAFVRAFCAEHGIPLTVKRVDVAALAKERGQTVEECGRNLRYSFFAEQMQKDTDRIATAHTLSDSAETVLFHLARGTGVRGLCGIPAVRGNIIRPLIQITREEVEEYCAMHNLEFVQDSTNFSEDYTRNYIRLSIMPQLRAVNPSVTQAVGRLSHQMTEQEEAIACLADRVLAEAKGKNGYAIAVLRNYPKAAVQHGLLGLLRQRGLGNTITDQKMQKMYECILRGSGGVTFRFDTEVRVEQGVLLITEPKRETVQWEVPFAVPLTFTERDRQVIVAEKIYLNCKNSENYSKYLFHNSLDYDTIKNTAVFRTRRDGDIFRPKGRGVTKKLKKLLQEAAIPPSRRDDLLVLADGSKLLWVEEFGVAEEASVTENTKQSIMITIKDANNDVSGFRENCNDKRPDSRGRCKNGKGNH